MKALNFPKSNRLLKPADYGKVFDDVQLKVPHRNFLILATPNSLGHARIGLVFAKKNLKLAVQRNRVKRRVRESFRLKPQLPALDIIILARQGLAQLDNKQVNLALQDLWQRLERKHRQSHAAPVSASSAPTGKGTD